MRRILLDETTGRRLGITVSPRRVISRTEVGEDVRGTRLQLCRSFYRLETFGTASHRLQHQPEIAKRIRAVRVEADRRAQAFERLLEIARLVVRNARVVKRVRVARLVAQDRVVDRDRVGEPAVAMKSGGARREFSHCRHEAVGRTSVRRDIASG